MTTTWCWGPAVGFAEDNFPHYKSRSATDMSREHFGGGDKIIPGLGASFHVALGTWLKVFGVGIRQARLLSYLSGIILVISVFFLGTLWWHWGVGLVASLFLLLDSQTWVMTRILRQETLTVAGYLLVACLLSIKDPKLRNAVPEISGLLFGFSLAGMPHSACVAPVVLVIPLLVVGGLPKLSYLLRFLIPAGLPVLVYGVFLLSNWESVNSLLGEYRKVLALGWSEFPNQNPHVLSYVKAFAMEAFNKQGIWLAPSYSLALLSKDIRLVAAAGWVVLGVCAVISFRGKRSSAELASAALFFGSVPVILIFLGLISPRYHHFYDFELLPWLYLAGAAGLYCGLQRLTALVGPVMGRVGSALPAVGLGIMIILASLVAKQYLAELDAQRKKPTIGYEQVEDLLASYIPPGSIVIGNDTVWLAAKKAQAEIVFGKVHAGLYLPTYSNYPVAAEFGYLSRLTMYSLDIGLLRYLHEKGSPVFYVMDVDNWYWSIFNNHGKAFVSLQKQLDEFFTRVAVIYSRGTGFLFLYRFGKDPSHAPDRQPDFFLEGVPYSIGSEMVPQNEFAEATDSTESPKIVTALFQVKPGALYWLETLVKGRDTYIFWNDAVRSPCINSDVMVPFYSVERSEGAEVSISAKSAPRQCQIGRTRLRPLIPTGAGATGPSETRVKKPEM